MLCPPTLARSRRGSLTIVTGGGTGLGLVTAAALAENGAKVYITGRRLETLEAAAKTASPKSGPGKIIPVQADAATKDGVQSESLANREEGRTDGQRCATP